MGTIVHPRASTRTRRHPQRHPPGQDRVLTRIRHIFEAASAYLFFLMVALVLLYVVGNLQGFTVETQELVLGLIQALGYAAVGVNAYSFLIILLWGIRHRVFLPARLLLSLLSLILGAAMTLAASFIAQFLRPGG